MRPRAYSNVDDGGSSPGPASLRAQGTYDVLRSLGTGGTGDLLLAVRHGQNGFRKLCVVKQLRRTLAMDAGFRDMFLREGRLAARMNHPNIVSTYDVGDHEGALYVAMEYLEGQTLKALLAAMQQSAYEADPLLWVRVVSDVLAGLHYAHELLAFDGQPMGVVHRDVGPHNVFITYEGRVVLLDFGSGKLCAEASRVDRGAVIDRLDYMAPELRAGLAGDRRADVFSAGVVLRELVGPKRDPRVASIIARATAHDPNDRYATAAGMREALEQYCDEAGRMLRRDALASLASVLFDDDRRRAQEDVRTRLARLDSSPDASGTHEARDAERAPIPAESHPKPRLELLEEEVARASTPQASMSVAVLSSSDIVSSEPGSGVTLSSLDAILEPSSGVVVDEAAVSIPAGPETASGSLPGEDVISVPAGPETASGSLPDLDEEPGQRETPLVPDAGPANDAG